MIIEKLNTIFQNVANIFKSVAPESNPNDPNTLEGVEASVFANIEYGKQSIRQELENNLYIATATGVALDKKGADRINPITRLQPSASIGKIFLQGTAGVEIDSSNTFTINNITFTTTGGVITLYSDINIQSAFYSASENKIYITTNQEHNLATGIKITTTGFNESQYNKVDAVISCIDSRTFTFTPSSAPLITPATGSGKYQHTSAILDVASASTGSNTNFSDGSILNITNIISNANTTAFVNIDGLRGGEDLETDENYRARLLDANQSYLGVFSEDDIILRAKEISGVTQVKILNITPRVGFCTILFLRGNDLNPIPSSAQVAQMKSHLLSTRQPTLPEENIIVTAPTPVYAQVQISSLVPNTQTMKDAIRSAIINLRNKYEIGESELLARVYNVINGVQDSTGALIESFNLNIPSADNNIDNNEVILSTTSIVDFV